MNPTEHSVKAPSGTTGFFATLDGLLRAKGTGASSLRLLGLLVVLAALTMVVAAVSLGLTASPASAAIVHPYQSQITEAGGAPLGGPLSLFGSLRGLAVDSAGNLYLSDAENVAIDKYDSSGAPVTAWGTNGQITAPNGEALVEPFGLTVDAADDLWAIDPGAASLIKLEPNGSFVLRSTAEGRISTFAQSLAYSTAADRVFVMDSGSGELLALKPDGTFESTLASFGTCCFFKTAADNSTGATGGDLYVSGENNAVTRIHATNGPEIEPGVFEYEAGQPDPFSASAPYIEGAKLAGGPSGPFGTEGVGLGVKGLAVDSAGNLFVAGENGVFEFAPSGAFLGKLTGTPTGPAGAHVPFGEVTSVGVGAASGRLYVGDSANHVVDVFGAGLLVPEVTTLPATAITTTSATFNGEVNPEGLAVEECTFEWGSTTAYGELAPCESPDAAELGSGTSPVAVHADVTTLPSGQTIHFRLAATNANGTNSESADQSFFTGASIDSTSASEVSATAATLETELNPHGLPTTYRFEYDTVEYAEAEAPHGTATPTGSAGSGEVAVFRSAQIQGLEPNTVYHFRVTAENSLGTSQGPDRTFTTQGVAASLLPDSRAWEMVTPPSKFGSPIRPITDLGGLDQAAADGSAFTSVTRGPLGPQAPGNRSLQFSQWLSARGAAGGWSTQDITTPNESPCEVIPGRPAEYYAFDEDLKAAIVEPACDTPLSPLTTERTPYRREADGEFVPLVTEANVPPGTEFGGDVLYETATPDLGHVLLISQQLLTEEFQPGFEPNGSTNNVYELSDGALRLISVLPNGEPASEAGLSVGAGYGNEEANSRGVISDDGSRVFLTTGFPDSSLYLRDNATQPQSALDGSGRCAEPAKACTLQLDIAEAGCGSCASGGGEFQAANADGSRVFFTDQRRLTSGSQPRDLYMCEITTDAEGHLSCALTDLSVDPNPGEAANVQGVSAIDAAGEHVFFAARGVLTDTPNAQGEVARPGSCDAFTPEATCNLYMYDTATDQISLVAVLSALDAPDWGEGGFLIHLTARSSPNGRWFAFMSLRPLTGYDNRDAKSGQADAEVFLFDSTTGVLRCASCNPTGARPHGVRSPDTDPFLLADAAASWRSFHNPDIERRLAASIPGWTGKNISVARYQSRYLSDSGRLFFNAADALVPQDTNGTFDVYQYEPPQGPGQPASNTCTTASATYSPKSGGCVSLISSGTSPEESAFLDASANGDDVFFLTASQLSRRDVDSAFDVYDASVGGGEAEEVKPVQCFGDACQPPATPPGFETPGTALLDGPGNLLQCPKGKVKKHGKCVAKHHRKHHRKKSHRRAAGHNRGGQK